MPGVPLSCWAVSFNPDARSLAVGGAEFLGLFDVTTQRPLTMLEFRGVVRWVGFRPDGRSLAAAGESPGNPVLVFDAASGARTARLEGEENPLPSGAWRADGGLLATAGTADGTLRLWDMNSTPPRRRSVAILEPNDHGIEAVAFSPEGRHLVTANPDGTLTIVRLAKTGEVFRAP